jgi:hypothetical protein
VLRFLFLLSFLLLSLKTVFAQLDTFNVEGRKFTVNAPPNWLSESAEHGLADDTTWNYITRYIIDKKQLNARIAFRIIETTRTEPDQKRQKKVNYTLTEREYSSIHGIEISYTPKPVKNCQGCGYSYLQVFIAPLSDCRTLNIVFAGNGQKKSMDSLLASFNPFCASFIASNLVPIMDFSNPNGNPLNRCFSIVNPIDNLLVRLEYDSDWLVTVDSNSHKVELRQFYGCTHNAMIYFWLEQVQDTSSTSSPLPAHKPKPIGSIPIAHQNVTVDPRLTKNSPKFKTTLKDSTSPVIPSPSFIPARFDSRARSVIHDASWFHSTASDTHWEDITVDASRKIISPDSNVYVLYVRLNVRIEDALYEDYYVNVVDRFLATLILQNKFKVYSDLDTTGFFSGCSSDLNLTLPEKKPLFETITPAMINPPVHPIERPQYQGWFWSDFE